MEVGQLFYDRIKYAFVPPQKGVLLRKKWLLDFSLDDMKGWKYEGWAHNRTYEPGYPKYDPKNPSKPKHPETDYFLYYSKIIGGEKYWANVKMHNHYKGEVLYTIEPKEPEDIIREIKK